MPPAIGAGAAGLAAGLGGAGAAAAGGATLASAIIPAAVGAIGGLGSALMQSEAQKRQIEATKEMSMPGRAKVPLTEAQQRIADNMGTGLGLGDMRKGIGLGFNQQGGSRVQNLSERINRLKGQMSKPNVQQGQTKPLIGG